jgi:Zn-dependent protease with chaperone function
MTAAVLFAGYAVAGGWLAPALLCRRWAARSPRLAMRLWLALSLSWVVAVVLAILAATAPFLLTWRGNGMPPGGPPLPGGRVIAAAGLLTAAAVAGRAAWCLAGELVRDRRGRREHAALVAAAGRPDRELGVVILDHQAPAVYCLPCGRYRTVVSAGALAALDAGQMRAVLAHERAHLRCRHHLILAVSAALSRAFPAVGWKASGNGAAAPKSGRESMVPLLGRARAELGVLAEMAADDMATRRHDPGELAGALVILARAGVHAAALAAGGPAAIARVQRLLAPQQRRHRSAKMAAAAGLLLPAAIACLPLIITACDVAPHG